MEQITGTDYLEGFRNSGVARGYDRGGGGFSRSSQASLPADSEFGFYLPSGEVVGLHPERKVPKGRKLG